MSIEEVWKPIENYEGFYEVSNLGRVKSCARVVNDSRVGTKKLSEKILKNTKDAAGYLRVALYKNTKKSVVKVHQLVARHFCENTGGSIINHLDNNKENNVYINLEWTTWKGNMQHKIIQGRGNNPRGVECSWSKLNEKDVLEIKRLYKEGLYQKDIGAMFGIRQSQVSRICCGTRWSHK